VRPGSLRPALRRGLLLANRTGSGGGRCGLLPRGPVCGLEISGGPHRIRADRLRPHLCVVPRVVQSNPPAVLEVAQGVRRKVPKGNGGTTRPCRRRGRRRRVWSPHDSLTRLPWGCWLEGKCTKGGDGRRGEVGTGAGAAMAARRWCWHPIPVRERAGVRAAAACTRKAHTTVRVGVTARWGAGRDRASR
jgi:hypothetical protein